ncbi:phospholipid carrier-dependent glycosyltransferase [Actinomadura rudentiformis]|uniref:Phospholipid carrier-dependent glycosyltransferase n=1 Tax=Actinomadura rudentiformis TaxID=359158 RepID=A0A6H9YQZ5_9ACTN|nr:phospholipid carrier-dependent glycosyltransferase [Actinomadura rudentiformis]KAB2344060.1 phospholipid carrier-dependent glycosyltransferase [Actinomadura rudentiformis]
MTSRHLVAHRSFLVVFSLGAVLRVITMVGFAPTLWFNDSYDYVRIALDPFPHPIRPAGYGIFLWLLKPFHSLTLVMALQHLMGLGIGVAIYVLLRRYGLPAWGATLAAAPVLLDAYQIQLEQMALSDTLFLFLVVCAFTILMWPRQHRPPALGWCALAGLLLALATLTRAIGLPVLLLTLGVLVLWRVGWRRLGVVAVAGMLPLAAYTAWFHAENGQYALTRTDGVFLWGRTAEFAECAKIKPPPDLAALCPPGEPGKRRASSNQVWHEHSPIGWTYGEVFSPELNDRAMRFALDAIKAQPLDYVQAVLYGATVRTFWVTRSPYPTAYVTDLYEFPEHPKPPPGWAVYGGGTPASVTAEYEQGPAATHAVEPFATVMRGYQQVAYLPGIVLAGILLLPAVPWWRRRRRGGADGGAEAGRPGRSRVLMPFGGAVALLAVPPITTDFDYRYVLVAVPLACLATGLAFATGRPGSAGPSVAPLPGVQTPEPEHQF